MTTCGALANSEATGAEIEMAGVSERSRSDPEDQGVGTGKHYRQRKPPIPLARRQIPGPHYPLLEGSRPLDTGKREKRGGAKPRARKTRPGRRAEAVTESTKGTRSLRWPWRSKPHG